VKENEKYFGIFRGILGHMPKLPLDYDIIF
jgi:hypothetical protein